MFMRTMKKLFACSVVLVGLALTFSLLGSPAISAQDDAAYVRQVRVLDDLGIAHPAGLAFSSEAGELLVVEARAPAQAPGFDIIRTTLVEDRAGSARIAASITDPINMAFDGKAQRLLFLRSARSNLFEVRLGPDGNLDPTTLRPYDARRFGLEDPRGMTVDPASGDLFILDGAGPRLVRIAPDAEGGFDQALVSQVDLGQSGLVDLRGVAFDPTTGHLQVLNPAGPALYEITTTGQEVAIRDLTGIELSQSQGMVFAPSGDPTDDPLQMSLYLADSGQTGAVVELSFVQPAAPAAAGYTSTLWNTIDTSLWSPPSPDPAGIAYLPSANRLMISDSEVDETISGTTHWQGANLFDATLTGTLVYTGDTTAYSIEPTGAAFNPGNDHLFLSDDDTDQVYEFDPGSDGLYGTADDVVTSFDTHAFGNTDPEGIAFGQGHVFVADGVGKEVYRYTPGGSRVSQFDVAGIGLGNPEGIEYNADDGTLFIIDVTTELVAETTISGTAVLMIDIQAANPLLPSGVAYAPGSADPGVKRFYITDRRVDNNANPNENDGKVYEMSADLPPVVVFSQPTYTVTEGVSTATITVTLVRRSSTSTFNVNYSTSNGTATAGSDYTASSGTLTFASPDVTSQTFSVPITNDPLDELDETVNLTLSSPTNGAILGATSSVTLTITDNDNPPLVRFNSSTYNVNEAAGTAPITVTLSAVSGLTITVDYAGSDGTATAGSDYTAISSTLTFTPGQTSQSFSVPILEDALDEANETVNLTLSNPGNATLGTPASATLTIADNDAPPTVQLSGTAYSVDEGGSTAAITVTLSAASGQTVTVGYATSNGTATAGADYTAISGTLTFDPGQIGKTFSVPILEDALDETNETVNLTLSNPGNATPGAPASATLTLADNDPLPSVQFSAANFSEAESGGTVTITVFLSPASGQTVTVDYATSDGTATAGSDYTAASGTLTFTPSLTSQTFSVPILEDALHEENETVNLTLSNPGYATLGAPVSATLTLVDNDSHPSVQFSAATYSVAENGSTATISVTLSAVSSEIITVNYATSNGTATAGADYTAISGTLTFDPGQTSQTFNVPILEDALDEANETVNLTLSNAINATPGAPASATLTIVDNDGPPSVQFSASAYSVAEDGGTAAITVTLSAASGQTVSVDYATGGGTATAASDYTAASGTLTFNPGQTSKTFSVPILNDALDEVNETVNLTLSNPISATLGTASATLTIVDNDAPPTVQLSSTAYSVNEGGSPATITVTLSVPSAFTVSVNYATGGGTATAASDYTAASGTLTFNPGQTSKTFSVPILEDALDEPNETVNLTLSNPGNATLGMPASATLTIVDNDGSPSVQFSASTYSVAEDGGPATITVTLSNASAQIVTVDYATSDGTATAGSDYTATSSTLTFAPGETSHSFAVAITNDTLYKPNRTVSLTLSNPGNATLGPLASATLTIMEDDPALIYLPLVRR